MALCLRVYPLQRAGVRFSWSDAFCGGRQSVRVYVQSEVVRPAEALLRRSLMTDSSDSTYSPAGVGG